jgi:hypothetical protein
MTTTHAAEAAPPPQTADGDQTGAAVPAPTEVPLRIAGELAQRLAGTSRWQQ